MSRLMSAIADLLVGREVVLERVGEFLMPVRVRSKGKARNGLAGGVQLQELFGHVAHGLLHPGLGFFPGRAAELVEGRRRSARVLLNEIEPLQWNEQLVVAGVVELHELLHRLAWHDRESLQSSEPADPVVHVHDQVADLQIPEIRQEGPGGRSPALVNPAFLLEEIRFGKDQQRSLRQVEAARELPGRDEHGGARQIVRRADGARPDFIVGEKLDRAFGTARAGRDEHDGVAAVSRGPNFIGPVTDASVVLERRHRRHVHRARATPVDFELADLMRSAQPTRQFFPARGDRFERHRDPAARDGLRRRRTPLLFERHGAFLNVLELERHDHDASATRVVHDRRGSVERRRILGGVTVGQQFTEGTDGDAVDRDERPLRGAVETPDGLDDVPDELEADRLRVGRQVEVDHTATDAEFAVLVHRILRREAGDGEPRAEIGRGDLGPRRERQAHVLEPCRVAQPWHQRASGRDNEPGGPGREAIQRARPCRGNFEVRREAAIRIHFLRREGQHLREDVVLGESLQRCQKQTRIGRHLLDIRVGRHHEEHGRVLRNDGGVKCRRGRRQTREPQDGPVEAGSIGRRLEQRSKCE